MLAQKMRDVFQSPASREAALTPAPSYFGIPLQTHSIKRGPYGVSGEGECGAEPVSAKENCFALMFSIVQLRGEKNKHCQMGAAKFCDLSRIPGCSVIFFFLLNTPVSGAL